MAQAITTILATPRLRRPWLTHGKVAFLFYAISSSILTQGLLFGNRKIYASVLDTEISIFDGIVPTALAVLFLLFSLKGKVALGLFRAVSPILPFAGYLIGSILFVGIFGKGLITLVQCLLQLLFLYYGYAYACENEGDSQRVLRSVTRIFAGLSGLFLLSDIVYTQIYGFTIQVGMGAGRYHASFGNYVTLGYFASLQFVFWGSILLARGLAERKARTLLAFSYATLIILICGSRTAAWSALLALLLNAILTGIKRWVVLILSVCLISALLVSWYGLELRFLSRESGAKLSLNVDLTGREGWYREVWARAWEHPLFGSGWGSGDKIVQDMHKYIHWTHSQHLQLFHDLGAVGYLLFLFGWAFLFLRLWRASRRLPEKSSERLWLCIGMAFLVQVFAAMATDSVWLLSLYFGNFGFFLLGIALRYARRNRSTGHALTHAQVLGRRPSAVFVPTRAHGQILKK